MKPIILMGTALCAVLLGAAAGYRFGADQGRTPADGQPMKSTAAAAMSAPGERKVLYWKHPDGDADFAAEKKRTADGRDYVPVYDDQEKAIAGHAPQAPPTAERKLLYYRNPMGLPDTSPTPKKDWMGMNYIAVYEGEDSDASTVKVSLDKVQRAGVRSEEVRLVKLARPVRAPGIAKVDERTLRTITLRADGFIEKLYANEHGKHVKAGDPLFRVYSQEMLRAMIDYRIGLKESDGRSALLSGEQKLRTFEVPQQAIDEARRAKDVPMSFDWPSPVSGVIMEKKIVEGQMAKMGEVLFMIGDLSKIWVIADVPEQETANVKIGDAATIRFRGLSAEPYQGKVTFILHELDHAARTGKIRIEVANPDHVIKHEMYAEVEIDSGTGDEMRLAVPTSAVLDSGNRQIVLLDRGDGRFEPRPVTLGQRGDGMVEIREGVAAGDKVVVSANFLIDAESNLKAALSSFTADSGAKVPASNTEHSP